MVIKMLEGANIVLRPWVEKDVAALTPLRNDVKLQAQLLARARGSNEDQVKDWLQGFAQDNQSIFLVIADKLDEVAGFIQVKNIDTLNCRAEIGIALTPGETGKGLGSEAIGILGRYMKDAWNLHKLVLQVRSDNVLAIAAYKKCGFEACGVFREHVFIDGQWQDVTLMELFLQ
jgi:diamine N-acetyltransferase